MKAKGHDRINVQNDPVNLIDPYGLEDRVSSSTLRKQWEKANNTKWPKDTNSGWNQDVAHKKALADGGTNKLDNIMPKPRAEHMAEHMKNGDFKRWGKRGKKAKRFAKKAGYIGIIITAIDFASADNKSEALGDMLDIGAMIGGELSDPEADNNGNGIPDYLEANANKDECR